jgi:hypothetical protein
MAGGSVRSAFVIVAICAGLVAGCATPAPPTATAPAATPRLSCLGGIAEPVCSAAADAALAAVASSGRQSTMIWVNSGFFCPHVDCLFDLSQNFPYPMPPTGGVWVASVEIAFDGTVLHAGLHVAEVGDSYVPVLIGYREPLPGWCSGECPP